MAFFLTPRFAHAYQHCGPYGCAPAPRPRRVARPAPAVSVNSFLPFLSQMDELLSELDRESQRRAAAEQHQQSQSSQSRPPQAKPQPKPQPKRTFRARFDVAEYNGGYRVEGEVPGFEQQDLEIDVKDEYTLRIAGDTERRREEIGQQPQQQIEDGKMEGVTLTEPEHHEEEKMETEQETQKEEDKAADSDTESHRSYKSPTVEDDFEDLGAEVSSASSVASEPAPKPAEPKGKEPVVQEPTPSSTAVHKQTPPQAPAVQQQQPPKEPEERTWLSERAHGAFERTFQFPERIDIENVRAGLRNGVLTIELPKARAFEGVKRIRIE